MKKTSTLFALIVLAFVAQRNAAIDCDLIKDHDRRNMCRAEAKSDPSYCDLIADHDMRTQCRAKVVRK